MNKRVMAIVLIIIMVLSGCSKANPTTTVEEYEDFSSWCFYSDDYLEELKNTYKLEELTKDCSSDYEKVITITKWVTGLWKHDGNNEPEQNDPLYVLDQVVNHGQRYRCVEYGLVVSGCLNALGIPSRKVGLKMKTAETEESGAGHVGCEVYLKDLSKWIWTDGQWGAIPEKNNTPLNAYEFGEAIRSKDPELSINWVENIYNATNDDYYRWIEPYLFYLNTDYMDTNGESRTVMYVPKEGKEITVFQRIYPIDVDRYLHNIDSFYQF